jgi:hypothetical protein
MNRSRAWVAMGGALIACWTGCGAKTGLLVPDAEVAMDAATPRDAGPDARCSDVPIAFTRREVEATFVIDRSGSMGFTWDGLPGGSGLPTRWEIVRDTLAGVLPPYDARIAMGAKLFPDGPGCGLGPGLDVRPHLRAVPDVLALFDRWLPEGGTPTAVALRLALEALGPRTDSPRIIVLATDGAPNCNDMPDEPPETCVCTGTRRQCLAPPPYGPEECLDATRTLDVLRAAYSDQGVPVVVIGIDDPSRPDLADFLDRMAIAGGWPRPEGMGRRFYDAREPEDLATAFGDIAELISRCVLTARVPPPEGAIVDLQIDGRSVPRDPGHVNGWDWTDPERGVLALFGESCDALTAGSSVAANIICADE